MAPTLPASLSPHICIVHSPDVLALLESVSLPPLPQILQAFSPLSQITTRTTSLTSVSLPSFALRFSDIAEVEAATHEDEEQRSLRTMDWIGSRVSTRCPRWVEMVEAHASSGNANNPWKDRTPWWEEVKRCVEGDFVPSRTEGWNHPAAVIYVVSTTAVNPLQALQDLTNRPIDLPPWIDNSYLRYFLILHPASSQLSDPIAESLFNAVKKQYGLHSYLLSLNLPSSPLPQPVPVPIPAPRLPPQPTIDSSPMPPSQPTPARLSVPPTPYTPSMSPGPQAVGPSALGGERSPRPNPPGPSQGNVLLLDPKDIQQIGRFTREFATMSLIPWMEKCVVDWNESFTSSRRLPSRLFSSTRRLFGSGYASSSNTSTPTHGSNPSISSIPSRVSHAANSSVSSLASISSIGGGAALVNQQRRLAEFATILGDFKLAISVWEALRKESKGGSDILPLLTAPSPAHSLLASNAINLLHTHLPDSPAQVQLRSLAYAVRWDLGIDYREFLSSTLEGERWLVHAAGNADETPMALLLGHAAFLSEKKNAYRRSALWYLYAADRLEKAGMKPLAMYYFRRAHELYKSHPEKNLSPSFWESEGREPTDWIGFEGILPGIEHELGRLMYTTGDTEGAVKYFLGLLRGSSRPVNPPSGLGITNDGTPIDSKASTSKVYLEDFRVALRHFKTTESERWASSDLRLPISFCQAKQSRVRLPGDSTEGPSQEWDSREEAWDSFWKTRGKEKLEKGGKAAVDETFWVDLVLRNPLDVEVSFSGLTVTVEDAANPETVITSELVEVETIDDISLGGKETRTIPISIRCRRPMSLKITQAKYDFLALLPNVESLAVRGRRLQDTPYQRQNKVYAPDIVIKVEVEDASQRLLASFVDDRRLVLAEGECSRMHLWVQNSGTEPIKDLWVVPGPDDEIWVDYDEPSTSTAPTAVSEEVVHSDNSLKGWTPVSISVDRLHSSDVLNPGENIQLPIVVHAAQSGDRGLCLLLVYRQGEGHPFRSKRLVRHYDVRQIFEFSISAQPSSSPEHSYFVNMELENMTTSSIVEISQVTTISPTWSCFPLSDRIIGPLSPRQIARATFGARPSADPSIVREVEKFMTSQLRNVLHGLPVESIDPPAVDLHCRHLAKPSRFHSLNEAATRHFIHCARRSVSTHAAATTHPYIPSKFYPYTFPLYNPYSADVIVFWEIPSQDRSGFNLLTGLRLGASHAPLREVIEEATSAKVKRSMYAETQREKEEVVEAVRTCEWNAEMNPITVSVHDGLQVQHNFSRGPCHVHVPFTIRSHSLTHTVNFRLKLPSGSYPPMSDTLLPPSYAGRLTFKGSLAPSQSTTLSVKLVAPRSGSYAIDGWVLETEVLELSESEPDAPPRVRHRYEQRPPEGDRPCVTVVNVDIP